MDDVFEVQDEIARTVSEKLQVELLGHPDSPLVTPPTRNLDAPSLFLQGRQCYARLTRPALDPGFGRRLAPYRGERSSFPASVASNVSSPVYTARRRMT